MYKKFQFDFENEMGHGVGQQAMMSLCHFI